MPAAAETAGLTQLIMSVPEWEALVFSRLNDFDVNAFTQDMVSRPGDSRQPRGSQPLAAASDEHLEHHAAARPGRQKRPGAVAPASQLSGRRAVTLFNWRALPRLIWLAVGAAAADVRLVLRSRRRRLSA